MELDKEPHGSAIVIMGVSGAGKSTIAEMLAKSTGCSFVEADHLHSEANKEKMRNGIPLSEEDRIPWLESLRNEISKHIESGETTAVSCSALQKKYREILRSADPEYKPGDYGNCVVKFVLLDAPVEVIADRINRRFREGNHYMPATLLESQYALLQIDEAEGISKVDGTCNPQVIVDTIIAQADKITHVSSKEYT